jgi:hypothetical protein
VDFDVNAARTDFFAREQNLIVGDNPDIHVPIV